MNTMTFLFSSMQRKRRAIWWVCNIWKKVTYCDLRLSHQTRLLPSARIRPSLAQFCFHDLINQDLNPKFEETEKEKVVSNSHHRQNISYHRIYIYIYFFYFRTLSWSQSIVNNNFVWSHVNICCDKKKSAEESVWCGFWWNDIFYLARYYAFFPWIITVYYENRMN